MRGRMTQGTMLLGIAVLLGALWFGGFLKLPVGATTITAGAAPLSVGGAASATTNGETVVCADTGQNSLSVEAKNQINSALEYLNVGLVATDDVGVPLGSATASAAGTRQTIAVPCGQSGILFASSSSSFNSQKQAYKASMPLTYKTVLSENASYVNIQWRNSALGNSSGSSANMSGSSYTEAAIGSGGTLSGYVDLEANVSNGAYGSRDGGVIIAWDLDTAQMSRASGISMTSGTSSHPVTRLDSCPADVLVGATGSPDVCFKLPQIKTGDGIVRLGWTLRGDVANPTTDVVMRFFDLQYAVNTDGKWSSTPVAFNNAGTDVGFDNGVANIGIS